jgi:DNA topoisomerase-3
MGKILIIGEKREAMTDMSAHLGDRFTNNKGYLEGNKYIVSWAMGHLYMLEIPERVQKEYKLFNKLEKDTDYKMPGLIQVPFVPDNDPNRYDKKYNKSQYDFAKVKKDQIAVIISLLKRNDIDQIILAPDGDAEGERIGQDIVELNKKAIPRLNKIPVMRFWNSGSFKAKDAIDKAMREILPAKDPKYANLYDSAKARVIADYLVGMKLTKLLSEKYDKMISTGRVQAAILSLIYQREDSIKNFVPKPFWSIQGVYQNNSFSNFYMMDDVDNDGKPKRSEITSYYIKEEYDKVVKDCNSVNLTGIVTKYDVKQTKSRKPELLSTGDFQSKYMDMFRGTLDDADMVLEYLRDEGFTTYPRTDGHFFSKGDIEEVREAQATIKRLYAGKSEITGMFDVKVDNSIFNDQLASKQNHTPLSITKKVPSTKDFSVWDTASYKGKKLKSVKESYFLILGTLAANFLPDDSVETQNIEIEVNGHKFKKSGKKILSNGWRDILKTYFNDTTISLKLTKGDKFKFDKLDTKEALTSKPSPYNVGTLLKTMINVNKAFDEEIAAIDDAKYRKDRIAEVKKAKEIFKEIEGIGTNATRKTIIETLKKRNFIKTTGKSETIEMTQLGIFVVDRLPDSLKKLDTTAMWEVELDRIRKGELDYETFIKNIDKEIMDDMIGSIIFKASSDKKDGVQLSSGGKPSEKMVLFAKSLAEKNKIKLDRKTLGSREELNQWLTENAPAKSESSSAGNNSGGSFSYTISEKQLEIINNNCDKKDILNLASKSSFTKEEFDVVKGWLDSFFSNKTNDRKFKLTDKQISLIKNEKNEASKIILKLADKDELTSEEYTKVKNWLDKLFKSFKK